MHLSPCLLTFMIIVLPFTCIYIILIVEKHANVYTHANIDMYTCSYYIHIVICMNSAILHVHILAPSFYMYMCTHGQIEAYVKYITYVANEAFEAFVITKASLYNIQVVLSQEYI